MSFNHGSVMGTFSFDVLLKWDDAKLELYEYYA